MKNFETYTVHCDLIQPLLYMGERGMRVDAEAMAIYSRLLKEENQQFQEQLNTIVGKELNINSPKQMKDYFYVEKGVKPYTDRNTGAATVNAETLIRLGRRGFKEASIIRQMRHNNKMIGSYLEVTLGEDGRLRSLFNPAGAESGRISSSKTIFGEGLNSQTIPGSLRKYLLADKGYILYVLDKAQAENRVVAYIAPEQNMIDAFEREIDVHKRTAGFIFGKPEDEISDEPYSSNLSGSEKSERDIGKQANHALNYGLGYRKFAIRMEISEADAKSIIDRYFSGYPGVRLYQNWVFEQARKTRTLINPFGRAYEFLDRIDSGTYYFIPQSTVADLINRWGLLYIWHERNTDFAGLELLNQVHDSVVYQIPISLGWEEHLRMNSLICQSLNQTLEFRGREFSIPTDVSMGFNLFKEDMIKLKKLTKIAFKEAFNKLINGGTDA